MKIPKTLKIGAHSYKVIEVSAGRLGSTDDASVDKEKGVITINKNLMQSEKETTLIHEVLHVMNNEIQHQMIESLAQQIYQFLHENKLLK